MGQYIHTNKYTYYKNCRIIHDTENAPRINHLIHANNTSISENLQLPGRSPGSWGEYSEPPKYVLLLAYHIEEEEELFDEWAPGRIQSTPERQNIPRTPSPLV